jgi:hypothetical protein
VGARRERGVISFDFSAFERKARQIDALQREVPFALSRALNEAALKTRQSLIDETWPKYVEVRNRHFLRAALRVEKASKGNLRVAVVDTLGRGNLKLHAEGGTKRARGRLAIPSKAVRRTAKGVARSQRPVNIKNKVVRKGLIFERTGKGENARLRLMYSLKPSAKIDKRVPFKEDFARSMRAEVQRLFPQHLQHAMRTARIR